MKWKGSMPAVYHHFRGTQLQGHKHQFVNPDGIFLIKFKRRASARESESFESGVRPPGGVEVHVRCGLRNGGRQLRHPRLLDCAAAAAAVVVTFLLWQKQPVEVAVDEPAQLPRK
jgi:hypothetical protein